MKAGSIAERAPAARTTASKNGGHGTGSSRAGVVAPAAAASDGMNGVVERPAMTAHYIRSRIGKICVAITGATPADMIQNAEQIIRENHFVEFRLDYLANPLAIIPKIKTFLYERGEVTAIATCRRAATGGKFRGAIAAELEILEKAALAGCHLIDVELQTAEHMKPAQMQRLRSRGAALIISYHD